MTIRSKKATPVAPTMGISHFVMTIYQRIFGVVGAYLITRIRNNSSTAPAVAVTIDPISP